MKKIMKKHHLLIRYLLKLDSRIFRRDLPTILRNDIQVLIGMSLVELCFDYFIFSFERPSRWRRRNLQEIIPKQVVSVKPL